MKDNDREPTEDERREENDTWEAPTPLYDPDDPGLLSDEIGRNYSE